MVAFPTTRTGRPNTSGTRGGYATQAPFPLAEDEWSRDNEQKFRNQLADILSPLQQSLQDTASSLNSLGFAASQIANDSSVTGTTVKDALNQLQTEITGLSSVYQPLDSDLTAIAALTTTSYGRGLLTLANAAAADFLVKASNLSDLVSASTARSNLGLGTSATHAATDFLAVANNLSDVNNVTTSFNNISPAATRGDLIVRGATNNQALAIGASATILKSNGTDPAWTAQGGVDTIASGNLSGTAVSITSIPGTYAYLYLHIAGASSDTATREMLVRVSTNNGSSYDGTAANYPGFLFNVTASASAATTQASLIETTTVAAATTQTSSIKIFGYQGGGHLYAHAASSISTGTVYQTMIHYTGSTTAVNAIQILWNGSGSFDAGTYTLYGVKSLAA